MGKLITPEEHTAGFKEYLARYFKDRGIPPEELKFFSTKAYRAKTGFCWKFSGVDCTTNFYLDQHGKLGFFNEMEFLGSASTIESVFDAINSKIVDQQSQYFARPTRLFVQGGLNARQRKESLKLTEGSPFNPIHPYAPTSRHVKSSCFHPYLNGQPMTSEKVHYLLACRVKPNPKRIARDRAPGNTKDPKYNVYDLYRDAFAFLIRAPLGVAAGLIKS